MLGEEELIKLFPDFADLVQPSGIDLALDEILIQKSEASLINNEKNIPEELEKKIRSNAMGWSPTSDTAATYTRRHTRQKANEAILEISNRLLDKYNENKK